MANTRRTIGALLVLIILPRATVAQEQLAASFDELLRGGRLARGDTVYITRPSGLRRIVADIRDLSSTELTLTDGRTTWVLTESEIVTIAQRDSVANGIWMGLGIGVIAMCIYSRSSEEAAYGTLYFGGPVVAGAAVVGALVDANHPETLYRASGSTRMGWSPTVSSGGLGARLFLEW